jgi:decaprenyl-phosphate phosphoribosyltransferase
MKIFAYAELIKFRYHLTFLTVVFAAMIFARQIDRPLLQSLFQLYVSFNVLFYGGIYTLNDLRDRTSDAAHPRKKNRPLPSGRIRIREARFFAALMITSGLVTALIFFGSSIFSVYLAVLAINLLYSFGARDIPYLDIAMNAATHPLRFLLGVLLAGRDIPWVHLVAYFFFVFGLCCLRRELEKDISGWQARVALKSYSIGVLRALECISLVFIFVLIFVDGFVSKGFYAVIIPTYLFLVLGARRPELRRLLYGIWTR